MQIRIRPISSLNAEVKTPIWSLKKVDTKKNDQTTRNQIYEGKHTIVTDN